jgi:hypothetical protein
MHLGHEIAYRLRVFGRDIEKARADCIDVVLQDAPLLPDSIRREQNRMVLALRMQQDDGSRDLNQVSSGASRFVGPRVICV